MWLINLIKNLFTWSSNNEQKEVKKFSVWNYSVELVDIDSTKLISAISWLKDILWIGLKEAKDMLSNLPSSAISGISKIDAEKIKEKLEELWVKVEIKENN